MKTRNDLGKHKNFWRVKLENQEREIVILKNVNKTKQKQKCKNQEGSILSLLCQWLTSWPILWKLGLKTGAKHCGPSLQERWQQSPVRGPHQ